MSRRITTKIISSCADLEGWGGGLREKGGVEVLKIQIYENRLVNLLKKGLEIPMADTIILPPPPLTKIWIYARSAQKTSHMTAMRIRSETIF